MNPLSRSQNSVSGVLKAIFAAAFILFPMAALAQQPQLTLADLVIGLRSKKVTLEERNMILAGAVRERGITFSTTPEIEKELATTGASQVLIDAVKEKSVPVAVAPTPVPTPIQDFAFFKSRADVSLTRGDFALALPDYDKALSLKPDSAIAFLNRGRTYYSLKDYTRASADLDKAIELDPRDSKGYYNRGLLFESQGELEKARSDYEKAAELDPTSEAAKAMARKMTEQIEAKAAAAKPAIVEPPKVEAPVVKRPESIDIGVLSASNAIKIVKPIYPAIAQKANVEGKVVVQIELDTEGNVTSAKAVSGHHFLRRAAEDAADKSKFRPAMFQGEPIKGSGTITFNFSLKPGSE